MHRLSEMKNNKNAVPNLDFNIDNLRHGWSIGADKNSLPGHKTRVAFQKSQFNFVHLGTMHSISCYFNPHFSSFHSMVDLSNVRIISNDVYIDKALWQRKLRGKLLERERHSPSLMINSRIYLCFQCAAYQFPLSQTNSSINNHNKLFSLRVCACIFSVSDSLFCRRLFHSFYFTFASYLFASCMVHCLRLCFFFDELTWSSSCSSSMQTEKSWHCSPMQRETRQTHK